MYPPRFDYLAPASVEELIEALGERGGDAKVMAGGQSLIPSWSCASRRSCVRMTVAVTAGTLSVEHEGTTYWFCRPGCASAFAGDPARYLASA